MSKAEEQIFLGNLRAKGIEIIVDKNLAPITDMESLKKSLDNKETRKKIKISVDSLQKFYEAFAENIQKDFVFEGLLANKISNGVFTFTKGMSKSQNVRDFEFKYGVRIYSFESDIGKGLTEAKLIEYIKSGKIKLMVANLKALNDNKSELPELEEIFNALIAERDNYLKVAPKKEKVGVKSNTSEPTKIENQPKKEPQQPTTLQQQTAPQTPPKKQQSKQTTKTKQGTQPQQPQKNQKPQKNPPSPNQNNNLIEINSVNGRGIKEYKKTIDKFLKATYMQYGKDAVILAFEQYYEKNGNISRVKIQNKEREFKGEDRALKVLNAKYVEYVLNFSKNKDNNFYDLSPKERRLFEGIISMYSDLKDKGLNIEKIPEEIVKSLTDYIREPAGLDNSGKNSDYKMPEMQGISTKDVINIMVSSELDRMIKEEKNLAEKEGREPEFKKSPLEEKLDAFSNKNDNIQTSAIRYINSATSYDKSPNKSTAKANIHASKTQLLNYFINSVDNKAVDAIKLIPNIDLKKLEIVLESLDKTNSEVLNVESIISNPDLSNLEKLNLNSGTFIMQKEDQKENNEVEVTKYTPKIESIENLNSYLESASGLEELNFDSRLPQWKKLELTDAYIQRAVNMYAGLKVMIDKTRKTITEKRVLKEPVEQYEKMLENLLSIYERMMANGNDKLIANYIAINEAQKEIGQSTEKNSKSKGENITR